MSAVDSVFGNWSIMSYTNAQTQVKQAVVDRDSRSLNHYVNEPSFAFFIYSARDFQLTLDDLKFVEASLPENRKREVFYNLGRQCVNKKDVRVLSLILMDLGYKDQFSIQALQKWVDLTADAHEIQECVLNAIANRVS